MSAELVILINILFYLFGFSFLLYKRNQLSEQSIGLLSILINFIGVLFSMGIRLSDISGDVISYNWFYISDKLFTIDILLNDLTYLMYFLVQFIALWVQVFSLKYMQGDPSFGRYYAYLNLFILAMIGIVISGNLLMIFMFWELVGLCSYLLVGFWYEKKSATNAAMKAFLVNRIGDIGFFIGILLVYRYFGTLDVTTIVDKAQVMSAASLNSPIITTIGLLLFCGCVAKSAQLPLQVWLPDAMEGPTPVSALIHAATMVAAGIFLMARIEPILSPDTLIVMAVVGMLTMFFGACSALVQYDIKKLLAFSTISQLGLMVVGIGVGAVNTALFHLVTHAFFKAGLFLSAGAVIHHMHHEQDMRKMGNLRREIPIIYYTYTICAAALAGIPFFSGFLSKDAIVVAAFEWASRQPKQAYFIIPAVCLVVSGMSAYYMMRQVFLVFLEREDNPLELISSSAKSFYKNVAKRIEGIVNVEDDEERQQAELRHAQEGDLLDFLSKIGPMELSSIVMAIASIGFVFALNPFSAESSWFFHTFHHEATSYQWVAYIAILVALNGVLLGYIFTKEESYRIDNEELEPRGMIAKFIFKNFYLSELYQTIFVKPLLWISPKINLFDRKIIDGAVNSVGSLTIAWASLSHWLERNIIDSFVGLVANTTAKIGSYTRQIQNGKAQTYIITIFVCLVLMMILLLF
ncbi:MAG: NADH-quinone oxidoreductase subunit L [Emticicia sp.]|uniref:NADH-quinone oxidoreductase subunit L n=1 Tax=Emticicia sp. TaxID=1930953 RepID=UPI003BA790DD